MLSNKVRVGKIIITNVRTTKQDFDTSSIKYAFKNVSFQEIVCYRHLRTTIKTHL